MNKYIDLHMHTLYSDGALSVEELFHLAFSKDVLCLSITDHDTFAAYASAPKIAESLGVELIPGIEVSSVYNGKDVHILGYFCDIHNPEFLAALEVQHESRKERVKTILEKLRVIGIDISYEQVEELCTGVSIGRPHIAAAMCKAKVVSSVQGAFELYLREGAPAYYPLNGFTPERAVSLIKNAGGLAVMAHPEYTKADELIPQLVEYGIKGIEVYNYKSSKSIKKYKKIAKRYGLVETGGSDFHDAVGSFGEQKLPYSIAEELRAKFNS